jgi:hypothetical protein
MSGTLCIPVVPNAILLNPVAVVDVVIAVNYAMACRGQQGCHFLRVQRAAVIRRFTVVVIVAGCHYGSKQSL